ncbi:unnamed protein product [Miscanthus lutarioriparius]|uniref:Uncharacterized protein n=1 Tax=Miscanthus lutarioriparius TaxID=422564 RepID=A0A811NG66_9POAL|nr:unnamed protein product [Miscanthus lutarioriparius]
MEIPPPVARGLDSHPPGGFLNILKSTPQAASNGSSSQAIHIDVDNNTRTEKQLTWTKRRILDWNYIAWVNNSNDPIQANFKKNDQSLERCCRYLEDELNNFLDAQKAANEGRAEMLETQRRVSSEKLESRRLAHLAAKEHKEAVMLETYRSLLMQNTTGMPEDVKAEHMLALKCLRESLFNKND